MSAFFITASGTGIGKTAVTTALNWQLRQQGREVTALKPVISGYDPADPESDTALILRSGGKPITPETIAAISPWRYRAPLSPHLAAAAENSQPDFNALVAFCRQRTAGTMLVEGVGGPLVPLSNTHTVADWMQALGWPVILVAGSYLGAISHTLTALESLHRRQLRLHALIVSESPGSGVSLRDTAETLENFLPKIIGSENTPVVSLERIQTEGELWKHLPPLSWLCDT
jgi:dethiobiotin synthetase